MNPYLAKDFIQTAEGLCFAVVKNGLEHGKVLSFLRYVNRTTHWQKLNTEQANQWLAQHHPQYLHYSKSLAAQLHAVACEKITQHYQPTSRLQHLLQHPNPDPVVADLQALCHLLQASGLDLSEVGITGSLLIGAQHLDSDIDLVFYHRDRFQQVQQYIAQLTAQQKLTPLTTEDWHTAYVRRDCSLTLADYIWHEQRKYNKGLINKRKFDISLVNLTDDKPVIYQKQGLVTLTAQVSSDEQGFDYPATFQIIHPHIQTVVCFSATYNGQAQTGEWIEIAGQLEQADDGLQRIVVGSSREARGEYIKVLHHA